MRHAAVRRRRRVAPDGAIVVDTPDRVEVATHAARPGMLILADTYARGWVAEIDGRPTEIVPVHVALRGVSLPAGDHVITFSYRPFETYLGFGLALLTAVALVAWLALDRRRASTGPRGANPP